VQTLEKTDYMEEIALVKKFPIFMEADSLFIVFSL
jgi:hypothetical protein